MEPLLFDGDHVFVDQKKNAELGSLVLFYEPKRALQMIKEVKGIEGDYFQLLGSNRDFSTDSRNFGLIHRRNIRGVVSSKF